MDEPTSLRSRGQGNGREGGRMAPEPSDPTKPGFRIDCPAEDEEHPIWEIGARIRTLFLLPLTPGQTSGRC